MKGICAANNGKVSSHRFIRSSCTSSAFDLPTAPKVEMSQPFEFKNPLEGAPRPILDGTGKNPFADEEAASANLDDGNIFATSGTVPPNAKPEYLRMLTHRGPLLRRLGIVTLLVCVASGVGANWQPILSVVLLANGVLAVSLLIKVGLDLKAIRLGAMDAEGRTTTTAALVLSLITVCLTVLAVVLNILTQT